MNTAGFFFRTAWHNLLRGGQRSVVAALCVAFGVMSLVAMTQLSGALAQMFVADPQALIGADMSLDLPTDEPISAGQEAGLTDLQKEGLLSAYTLADYSTSVTFRRPDSGELFFPGAGIGIDPAAYPPVGALTVESPGNVGIQTLLARPGDVIISRDLALRYGLAVGDALVLSDLSSGAGVPARIQGIVLDTPNHVGSKLYYNHATASLLVGGRRPYNTVLASANDPVAAEKRLKALGWNVWLAIFLAEAQKAQQQFFGLMLNGAGLLALLVGGIGVANTMQVLMRRRQREIAIWKSLGYTTGQLVWLFALEDALLGLLGCLLGAALGMAISAGMVNLFTSLSTVLVRWAPAPAPVIVAMFAGLVTTLVFALWPVIANSRIRPVALLRDEPAAARLPAGQSAALALALAVPFTAAASLVMGALWKGALVLAVGALGLLAAAGALRLLLGAVLRLLPLRGAPLLDLARNNLLRRGSAPVFAMVALFAGVVALSAGSVVTQSAARVMDDQTLKLEGENLSILAPFAERAAIEQAIRSQPVERAAGGAYTSVRSIALAGGAAQKGTLYLEPVVINRAALGEFTVSGAAWGSVPGGAYAPMGSGIKVGDTLEVTLPDGGARDYPVVGNYTVDYNRSLRPQAGLLVPGGVEDAPAAPRQVEYLLRVDPARLPAVTRALGAALPRATVINQVAHAAGFTRAYRNFFLLAISMASLALLGGILLVANSVSLALLDRRYEIGVFKAMGYARRHILRVLVVEYGLMALVACGTGLAMVRAFLWLATRSFPLAGSLLALTNLVIAIVGGLALGLTLLTVLAVSWRPTQVSPLVVLNDRG